MSRYAVEAAFFFILLAVLYLLPLPWAYRLTEKGAIAAFTLLKKRRQTALQNLERVFGSTLNPRQKREIARESFIRMAYAMMDLLLAPKILKHADSLFTIKGLEEFEKAVQAGQGILFTMSHFGSWEFLSRISYEAKRKWNIDSHVVVKSIKNPLINGWINRLRKTMGVTPVHKRDSSKLILKQLKNRQIIAVLIDQWAGPEGIWTEFFGHPTSTTSIPARLAHKLNAALIPGFCRRKSGGGYLIEILPAVPISQGSSWEKSTTDALNRILESEIGKTPSEWLWAHKRWKNKPSFIREI